MTEAVEALGALAQDSRLAVFRLLVRHGDEGLPAGEISEQVGIPQTTLSFHLSQMARAGLLLSRREGRSIYYSAHYARMNELLEFLMANCCEAVGACPPGSELVKLQRRPSGEARRKGYRT
ncbi:MAG TPA: metalloregulator ArsR/SmtB family transcription factor [Vicinamibacteria bacterium]|nr:metalloregulator ArsR/SmtB family transcription factor [Vicinamibacteria bacterium]